MDVNKLLSQAGLSTVGGYTNPVIQDINYSQSEEGDVYEYARRVPHPEMPDDSPTAQNASQDCIYTIPQPYQEPPTLHVQDVQDESQQGEPLDNRPFGGYMYSNRARYGTAASRNEHMLDAEIKNSSTVYRLNDSACPANPAPQNYSTSSENRSNVEELAGQGTIEYRCNEIGCPEPRHIDESANIYPDNVDEDSLSRPTSGYERIDDSEDGEYDYPAMDSDGQISESDTTPLISNTGPLHEGSSDNVSYMNLIFKTWYKRCNRRYILLFLALVVGILTVASISSGITYVIVSNKQTCFQEFPVNVTQGMFYIYLFCVYSCIRQCTLHSGK